MAAQSKDPKGEKKKMTSFRLTEELDRQIDELASSRNASRADIVREAVAEYIVNAGQAQPGSFLEQAADLAGSVDGPEDLSSNPDLLDDLGL